MEHQKILNFLIEENDSKFVTRKWNIVNDKSKINYNVRSEIIYNRWCWRFRYSNANVKSISNHSETTGSL